MGSAASLLFLELRNSTTFASIALSRSSMNECQASCSSSCSVDSEDSGRSFLAGEMKVGILGSLDKGSTFECARPGLCIMTISGKAAKTRPHAARQTCTK